MLSSTDVVGIYVPTSLHLLHLAKYHLLHPCTLFCITPILPISCSSRRSTCNHPRPFLSCSQQSCHNCTHEIELSVPTHPENKTSLHCSEARTLINLYSIDCRDRGLDRKTIRIAVNSRARFRSTNAPVPSPTTSHTTFYSTPVSQPRARTHAMKSYSTLRIHSYQPRVRKALVIFAQPFLD